jgi:hypothetical protein
MRENQQAYSHAWTAYAMLVAYLQQGMIADQVVPLCEYFIYDPKLAMNTCMEIDSQATA